MPLQSVAGVRPRWMHAVDGGGGQGPCGRPQWWQAQTSVIKAK